MGCSDGGTLAAAGLEALPATNDRPGPRLPMLRASYVSRSLLQTDFPLASKQYPCPAPPLSRRLTTGTPSTLTPCWRPRRPRRRRSGKPRRRRRQRQRRKPRPRQRQRPKLRRRPRRTPRRRPRLRRRPPRRPRRPSPRARTRRRRRRGGWCEACGGYRADGVRLAGRGVPLCLILRLGVLGWLVVCALNTSACVAGRIRFERCKSICAEPRAACLPRVLQRQR